MRERGSSPGRIRAQGYFLGCIYAGVVYIRKGRAPFARDTTRNAKPVKNIRNYYKSSNTQYRRKKALDKNEFATRFNSYVTDYIKFADVKASILLTANGLLAGGVIRFFPAPPDALKCQPFAWWVFLFLAFAFIVTLICSIWMSIEALNPNIDKTEKKSLHSFPDVAELSYCKYIKSSEKLKKDKITSHFYIHNWTLSCIANNKFKSLKQSVSWLKWAIILAVILWGYLSFFSL